MQQIFQEGNHLLNFTRACPSSFFEGLILKWRYVKGALGVHMYPQFYVKYYEAQTISYLCIRGKDERDICRRTGELNKSRRQWSTEAETRDLISGHTREISMSLNPIASQRISSKHDFRMNRFFIRKIFILHYGRTDNNKHNESRLASGIFLETVWRFQISTYCIFSRIRAAQFESNKLKFFPRDVKYIYSM